MIDKRVHLPNFFRSQQMIIAFAYLDHFHHMVVQRRRPVTTVALRRWTPDVRRDTDNPASREIVTAAALIMVLMSEVLILVIKLNVERLDWEIETLCSPSAAQSRTRHFNRD